MTLHIEKPPHDSRIVGSQPAPPFRERRGTPAAPPIRLAHIVSVSGSHAVAMLERQDALANDARVQIGALIKVVTPTSAAMGVVTAISAPMPAAEGEPQPTGLIEINLAGEVVPDQNRRLTFRRGISSLPTLGDAVLLADKHDLTRVYAPPQAASIKIGTLFQESSVPARLLIDDLLAKHFLIVGSTGSGKSSAVTCILQRLLAEHTHAHMVILDIHNEYSAAFGGLVEPINLDNFSLPFWMLDFEEMCAALVQRDAHYDAEVEILSDAVVVAKKRYNDSATSRAGALRKAESNVVITVDTPTPFRMSDIVSWLDDQLGRLERTQFTLPYRRLKSRIESLVTDQRYSFMFGSLSVQDTMGEVLARLFRVPGEGRPISVIDLSTVPPEILDVVISVISRLAFDVAVWSKGGLPMLLVCEEAHRYAPAGDKKFVPTRAALSRIAKEGRKYGLSLCLVTQRPSELDATILSQCGTAVVLRLSSEKDQDVIRGATYEGLLDLVDFLPLLGDREAIVLGQGVSMPMRVRFDDLGKRGVPRSLHTGFSKAWKTPNMDREGLDEIVARWRRAGRERS
jgi:DNA helicase HerA-like ATPase